jgi:hypothetical protein
MDDVAPTEACARLLLAASLFGLAALKVASGYDPSFTTPAIAYWALTVVESTLAALALTGRWRLSAYGTIAIAVGGTAHWLLLGSAAGSCGCAGHVEIWAGRTPLVLAAVLGMLSCASLMSGRLRRAPT